MTEHGGPHLRYFDDDARDECLFIDRRVLPSGWWDPTALHPVVRRESTTTLLYRPPRWPRQEPAPFKPDTCAFSSAAAESLTTAAGHTSARLVRKQPQSERGQAHCPFLSFHLETNVLSPSTSSSFLPELPPLLHTFPGTQQGLGSTPSPLLSLVLENIFIVEYNVPLSSFLCVLPHSQHTYFHVCIPWCPAHSDT